jgi:hypothetical protein
MKNYALIAFIIGFTFIFHGAASAQKDSRIIVEVPFEFTVNDMKFEAGKYIITRLQPQIESRFMRLLSWDGKKQTIFTAVPVSNRKRNAKSEVKLLFNRYANQYYLSGISDPLQMFNLEVLKSEREIQIAKNYEIK